MTTSPNALDCPICKGTEFSSASEGTLFRKVILTCRQCGTRILKSGHAQAVFEVIRVAQEYSNCQPLFDGLRLSPQELSDISAPIYSDAALSELVQGNLPADILEDAGEEVPFKRHKGEKVIFKLENVISFNDRSWTSAKGNSFSYRQNIGKWQQAGKISIPRRQAVIESLDRGTLVLTTERYYFRGEQRKIDESLVRIANIFPYLDGMGLAKPNNTTIEYYRGSFHWPFIVAVWRGLIKLAASAEENPGD